MPRTAWLCTKGMRMWSTRLVHSCSCLEDDEYKVDQIFCGDVDECRIMNGGCQQSCTNTFGSFRCSCEQGYRMLDDGFNNCEALSCDPVLEAPLNGSMDCDTQTVGGTCNFTCDEGYTLRGSDSRTCLPSLQWREPPAICDPPMCPRLTPPDNGFVLFPCTREEGHLCRVVCAHGYSLEGPSNQTCRKDNSGSLVWSDGPQCVESSKCSPNPCLNGGFCIEDETDFTCVCNGTATGYGGETCKAVIVNFEPIPPVTNGLDFQITLYTDVKGFSERVRVNIDRPKARRVLRVNGGEKSPATVTGAIGVVRVSLPRSTPKVMYVPRERNVYISGGSDNETQSYFERFNLTRGLLQPSCCSADDHVTLSCPGGSTQSISLLSPCQWSTTNVKVTRANGAVFAKSGSLSLPTSVSGLRYREIRNTRYTNDLRATPSECKVCSECNNTDPTCYCYIHTQQDTAVFLQTRALAFTYISQIKSLLPPWLELLVDLQMSLESTGATKNDLFAPITRPSEPVSSFEGCDKLTTLEGSRYSVLRHDKTLSAVIDSQRYDYREDNETGTTGDVMCFAVDLCHKSESPVHMQLSQPINDILVYQYLRGFTDRQWNILLNTVSVFKQSVTQSSDGMFWNGVEMISFPGIETDVSVNGYVLSKFHENNSLDMDIEFNGDVSLNYTEREGLLNGKVTLNVSSVIAGGGQNFIISSPRSAQAYVHVGNADPCNNKGYGLSFTASYRPQPGELFFTRLFRFTEITQSCSFSAFLPITSDYRALGLSLHTECPLLAIGHLILPEMSHTITFIGSENPNCFTSNFLEVPDPALVIESDLLNNHSSLGNIFKLQANSTGPDVVTVFGREDSGPVSQFHSVQVTLFAGVFESEATVRNDQLTISTSSGIVFGYPAELTITAPS
ncbi:P-selectin, partial [Geodia barretti]